MIATIATYDAPDRYCVIYAYLEGGKVSLKHEPVLMIATIAPPAISRFRRISTIEARASIARAQQVHRVRIADERLWACLQAVSAFLAKPGSAPAPSARATIG